MAYYDKKNWQVGQKVILNRKYNWPESTLRSRKNWDVIGKVKHINYSNLTIEWENGETSSYSRPDLSLIKIIGNYLPDDLFEL